MSKINPNQVFFLYLLLNSTLVIGGEIIIEKMNLPKFKSSVEKEYTREVSDVEKVQKNFISNMNFALSSPPTDVEMALQSLNRGFIAASLFSDLDQHLREQKKLLDGLEKPLKNADRYEGIVFYNSNRKPVAFLYKTLPHDKAAVVLRFTRTLLSLGMSMDDIFSPFFKNEKKLYMYTDASKETVEKSLRLRATQIDDPSQASLYPSDMCDNKKLFMLE